MTTTQDRPTTTQTGVQGVVKPKDLALALTAVIPHAGTDKTLPMLCAVKFESEGTGTLTIVATQRYTLGTYVLDWDGGAVDALLDVDSAKELLRYAKGVSKSLAVMSALSLTFTEESVEAFDLTRRASYPLMQGTTFVSWRAIMPTEDRQTVGLDKIAWNPKFLTLFAKAAERNEPMRVFLGESNLKPTLVKIGENFAGLIMPVRVEAWGHVAGR